jgi:ferric-dicitrate binding protein FerR (iron transport regulator)
MEPTPHDHPPHSACSDDVCLSEALDWIVRLNRLRAGKAELLALEGWCARSAAHARAWRDAQALWQLLLPAACAVSERRRRPHSRGAAPRPRIASKAGDIRICDPAADADAGAASDIPSSHFRPGQSWS